MNKRNYPLAVMLLVAGGCTQQDSATPATVGLLESLRLELSADALEPLTEIAVREGESVAVGTLLMRQDSRRTRARRAEATAVVTEAEARLAELTRGPRKELIDAARASVRAGERDLAFRRIEFKRAQELLDRQLGTPDTVDTTRAARDQAAAQLDVYRARLAELLEGTTVEEIAQAEQRVAQAQARVTALDIDLEQLAIRAPADAYVDDILAEVGERPQRGQTLIVLLAAAQPYARVYVPAALRIGVTPGTAASVRVDGIEQPIAGRVRRVAGEAAFTPYFALTRHDRGRLSYVAEIDLQYDGARLPDGVPVEVAFASRAAGPPQ